MIRLLHLITTLDTGGAEMMLCRLLATMDRNRFSNRVVSMTAPGPVGDAIRDLGIPLASLGMPHTIPSPLGLWRLSRIVREYRPHVLQSWLYHADLLGTIVGGAAGVPALVWNVRCSDMDVSRYHPLTRWVIGGCVRLSSRPAAIVVNSEAGKRYHASMGYRPRRWEVIPNGFDLDRYRPDPGARRLVRRELGVAEDTPLVGLIARFDPMKDHRTFLEAAALVSGRRPDVRFVLCGKGVDAANSALRAWLDELEIGHAVHLLGERRDIPTITAALDVAALSSAFGEGFPSVVGEAMACAVPCAVTDVGDAAALVAETGRVVPPRSPGLLAEALLELTSMRLEARLRLGMVARQRIAEAFSLPVIAKRYESLYQELAPLCVA